MANITEEMNAFELMLAKAEEMDKTSNIKPQVCNMDDNECEACGS
tara:strand:+ start:810 stop:944 length:135 start_codon:yes stop_codon:yes gene_type:complete